MKTKHTWLFLVLACFSALFITAAAHAADPVAAIAPDTAATAPSGVTADNIVQWLTPLIVPLIVTGMKKIMPSLPVWVFPCSTPVLGLIITLIDNYASNHSTNLLLGALLGLAGVGMREVKTNLIRPKEVTA